MEMRAFLKDFNVESFDQLAEQYTAMIHKIIHSLHIYKNVEEFYQIGLIGLWEARKSFDVTKGDFTSYAYLYIKGRLLSELTKASNHWEHTVFPKEEYWETVEEYHAEQPCEIQVLLSYCEGLTKNQVKWVVYTFIDDLSVREIAAKERVSVSAVKQWRNGAREKIKTHCCEMED
jgi:RNA polymerase sigma factor (sigma-70 family)